MEKYNNIPASLKDMPQWVNFKLEKDTVKGKTNKIPKDPKTGKNAKANDPATWSDYQTALDGIKKHGFDGLGFEFANGIYGVDLDHVVIDGKFTPEALDIIKTLDSYTEFSPSGTGAHILCRGEIPEGARRKGNVEIYNTGRFFTVTGEVIGKNKEVNERTDQAKIIHAKYLAKPEPVNKISYEQPPTSQLDSEIIEKACRAKNGQLFKSLWNGSISEHGDDHSAADQALCNLLAYWTNGNFDQMDSLFKQSGLMREKWNKKHGADTYGNMTIKKALEGFTPYTYPDDDYSINKKEKAPDAVTSGTKDKNTKEILYQENIKKQLKDNTVSNYFENHMVADLKNFKKYKDRKTGFENLDAIAGGLYPGLYVIGAISSLGKTTFIHQMADNLATAGDHVLFFSLEQNKLEMVTKSVSRIMAKKDINTAMSAIDLKKYTLSSEALEAIEEYSKIGDRVSIIPCNFDTNINYIMNYTKAYINEHKVKPVVIVDYLQIIPPTDPRQSDKEKVDNIVRGLKKLQSDNNIVVMVVSSINRTNYLQPIDFESFKESGGIEYTADVVWGLQLQCLNQDIFSQQNKIKEKRELVKLSKQENPRKVELVCLKNRYGISSYSCGFNYNPCYDLFKPNYTHAQEIDNYNVNIKDSRL